MNILERNIFDKNISFTQKLYQEKINEINKSEEIFRTIVKKLCTQNEKYFEEWQENILLLLEFLH